MSSNAKNEIVKDKIKKSTTSHFACHYCEMNGHISHICPVKRISKKCVKQVYVPKKIIHVNDAKANIQGPHVKRVPKKKTQCLVGTNTKKRGTKDLKKIHPSCITQGRTLRV